jgi:3',5'-nucleoside bisphosphate phosphatase
MAIYFSNMQKDPSPARKLVADLHIHSSASDGEYTPRQIAEMLTERNIHIAALADHDSIDGFREFKEYFQGFALPAVELSVRYHDHGLHLLAYGFDLNDAALNQSLQHYQQVRFERILKMAERLESMGLPVDLAPEEMQKNGVTLGRPHLARALLAAGHVKTFHEAFQRYIGDNKPAYISKVRMDFAEALEIIRHAGGVSILAHPGLYQPELSFDTLIQIPVNGFEVYHPNHNQAYSRVLREHCIRKGIPYSGGSDFHDLRKNKRNVLGTYGLLQHEWENFRAYLQTQCSYSLPDS